MLEYVN